MVAKEMDYLYSDWIIKEPGNKPPTPITNDLEVKKTS